MRSHSRPAGITRRSGLASMMALPACAQTPQAPGRTERELAALEAAAGGRLGVALFHPPSGTLAGWRLHERFALCSTFKLPLAGVILAACDAGRMSAAEEIPITDSDMIPYAPVVERHRASGRLDLLTLARAAQVESDNVAANLLLRRLGGPAAFTRELRTFGDDITRLDRFEPDLNRVQAGEIRDTTTPAAMAATTARLLTGAALSAPSQDRLFSWMRETTTGLRRLRAGLPDQWMAGDKTGTSLPADAPALYGDVAAVRDDRRQVLTIAAYYDAPAPRTAQDDADLAVFAAVGRLAAAHFETFGR